MFNRWAVSVAEIRDGKLLRAIRKNGKLWGAGMTQNGVWYVVKNCANALGWRPGLSMDTPFAAGSEARYVGY